MCESKECEVYPYYGVAPHECYWRKDGGFKNPLGTSTIEPLDGWPDNFLAEIDKSKPIEQQLSWGLCGVYFCPECLIGKDKFHSVWSKQKILEAITQK